MSNQAQNQKTELNKYVLVLGLEIHLQLNAEMKMFCSCKNDPFHGPANTYVCPVCLGLPGALPVPNKDALEKARIMASILGSELQDEILFERKNYFYPDLSKGYQITTPHYPIGMGGVYTFLFAEQNSKNHVIRWREIHLEEDTAKSTHKDGKTWIDFNKSGVPLLELVTEPDFSSIDQAVAFAKEIQMFARYAGISDADMEKGQMRLEANISLGKLKTQNLKLKTETHELALEKDLPDYRVELKNINSFTFMKKALEAELKRQTEVLDRGERLIQETRGYNEDTKETVSQREKEEAHDYRYFPEPDIPPIRIQNSEFRIQTLSPADVVVALQSANVRASYLPSIVADKKRAEFTLQAIEKGKAMGIAADAIAGEIINRQSDVAKLTPGEFVKKLKQAKTSVVSDEGELKEWIELAIRSREQAVADFKKGKSAALAVLIGEVMKLSQGKANARKVQNLLQSRLADDK